MSTSMSLAPNTAPSTRPAASHTPSAMLAVVPRRKRAQKASTVCMGGGFAATAAVEAPAMFLAGRLISATLWAGAAWLTYSLVAQQGPEEGQQECETCNGSGRVPCFCMRWSDSDTSGCSSCQGSLKMACPSCRGGGNAVPIEAKVYIKPEKEYY